MPCRNAKDILELLVHESSQRVGQDRPDRDSIHPHLWREILGEVARQKRQGGFRGSTGGEAPRVEASRHRRDVDDRSVARGLYDPGYGQAGHREGGCDVEAEAGLELILAGFEGGLGRPAARVVDQDVEASELIDGFVDEMLALLCVEHVAGDDQRAAAPSAHLLRGLFELRQVLQLHELALLNELAGARGKVQDIMLRVSPGIDPHTHEKTTTGILDSKFGFSVETGDAARAIREALDAPNLDLVGIHFHLGSPIFELEPYSIAIDTVLSFLAPFISEGLELSEFSPGGGFAIGYVSDQPPPPISSYAEVIATATKDRCADLGFGEPTLVVEPGRSIVGRAGVALYTVGEIKDIPTVRKYVSLDGGMGDNIRPALYGAVYEAVVASRMSEDPAETVTLAGKYCESGDILIRDIRLPALDQGDTIAIPASGAYAPSMASNYNLNPRPPVVMVKDGEARVIRRRETYRDMMACDVMG